MFAKLKGSTWADPDGAKRRRIVEAAAEIGHGPPDRAWGIDPRGEPLLLGERLPAVLERDPDNPHDENAIRVHVPLVGDDGFVGHVERRAAAIVAPKLDAGERLLAAVAEVYVHADHPDNPGIDLAIWRPE